MRRRELPKQIQPHGFTIKEKHKKKKCKTPAGTLWFLSRDFLNVCGPFHSTQGWPPGWFPADATGAPCQTPGRAQGKAPPGTAVSRVSRAHLPGLAGLRRRWSRLWVASRALRKKLFHLQNSEVLLARLAACCCSWAPRASFLTAAPPPPLLPCSALPFG